MNAHSVPLPQQQQQQGVTSSASSSHVSVSQRVRNDRLDNSLKGLRSLRENTIVTAESGGRGGVANGAVASEGGGAFPFPVSNATLCKLFKSKHFSCKMYLWVYLCDADAWDMAEDEPVSRDVDCAWLDEDMTSKKLSLQMKEEDMNATWNVIYRDICNRRNTVQLMLQMDAGVCNHHNTFLYA